MCVRAPDPDGDGQIEAGATRTPVSAGQIQTEKALPTTAQTQPPLCGAQGRKGEVRKPGKSEGGPVPEGSVRDEKASRKGSLP